MSMKNKQPKEVKPALSSGATTAAGTESNFEGQEHEVVHLAHLQHLKAESVPTEVKEDKQCQQRAHAARCAANGEPVRAPKFSDVA